MVDFETLINEIVKTVQASQAEYRLKLANQKLCEASGHYRCICEENDVTV